MNLQLTAFSQLVLASRELPCSRQNLPGCFHCRLQYSHFACASTHCGGSRQSQKRWSLIQTRSGLAHRQALRSQCLHLTHMAATVHLLFKSGASTCNILPCHQIQLLVSKGDNLVTPHPNTPRLLPSVHLAWTPLIGALQVRWLPANSARFIATSS